MGLKSWRGSRVRQQDVTIAKNYLEKSEIEELNQIVVMYLDYAENQAKNRKTVTMAEWERKLDAFLTFNEKDLLDHARLALDGPSVFVVRDLSAVAVGSLPTQPLPALAANKHAGQLEWIPIGSVWLSFRILRQ